MLGGRWLAVQVRCHVAVERVHLVEQLLQRPVAEADLEVTAAYRPELVEPLDEEIGRARQRLLADVPRGLADVEELGDAAEVDRLVADGSLPVLEQVRDLARHLVARRALRQPAVTPLGGAAERGLRRSADPDRELPLT